MQVKEVTVSFTRKLNMGNYESAEVGTWLTAVVEDDESEAEVLEEAWDWVKAEVGVQAQQLHNQRLARNGAKGANGATPWHRRTSLIRSIREASGTAVPTILMRLRELEADTMIDAGMSDEEIIAALNGEVER